MAGGVLSTVVCGVIGAVLGGLLGRPVYRLAVPAGAPIRTACDGCAAPAGWVAAGNCVGCGRQLGPPWWGLGITAGIASAGIGWRFGWAPELAPYLVLALLGVLLAAIDLAVMRLPDGLVIPGFAVGTLVFTGLAAAESEWWPWTRAALAAGVLAGTYVILALLPGAGLGYGDVKLAGLLGWFLGWLGWSEVLLGLALPFVLQGVVVIGLLSLRRVTRKTMLPFGPAMLAGAWLSVVTAPVSGQLW